MIPPEIFELDLKAMRDVFWACDQPMFYARIGPTWVTIELRDDMRLTHQSMLWNVSADLSDPAAKIFLDETRTLMLQKFGRCTTELSPTSK